MIEVTVVIREPGRRTPDYSLQFKLPAVPRPGDYISVSRPEHEGLWSEDCIVRKVWWRLHFPSNAAVISEQNPIIGSFTELMIECDIAEGPYASDAWLKTVESARERDIEVEHFDIHRFSVRQSDMKDSGEE